MTRPANAFNISLELRPGSILQSPAPYDIELLKNDSIPFQAMIIQAFCESLHDSTASVFSISGFKDGRITNLSIKKHFQLFLQQFPFALYSAAQSKSFDLEFYGNEDYFLLDFQANQGGFRVRRFTDWETDEKSMETLSILQTELVGMLEGIRRDLMAFVSIHASDYCAVLDRFTLLSPDSDDPQVREDYIDLYRTYSI